MNAVDTFRKDFEALDRAKGPLQAFRRAGWEKFRGFPTTREEAWRFTDLSPSSVASLCAARDRKFSNRAIARSARPTS